MWSKFANQNSEKMQKKVVWRLYTGILRVQMSIVRGKRDQEKTMKSPKIIAVLDRRRMDGASSFCQILCKSTI